MQVEVDEEKIEVSGQWNLASPLLAVEINGTERTLQVAQRYRMCRIIPQKYHLLCE